MDFHTFTGATGERVFLRMTGAFIPAVAIRRPDGKIGRATCRKECKYLQLEYDQEQKGLHAIVVTDRNLSQTGDYTFSLNRLIPPAGAWMLAAWVIGSGTCALMV